MDCYCPLLSMPLRLQVLACRPVGPPPEYTVLTTLSAHPNIIPAPVLTTSLRGRKTALVFPALISDLHAVVERGPLPEASAADITRQIFTAIAFMHAAGWAHLDVKLENVFVLSEVGGVFRVQLGDFGLAQRACDRVHSNPIGSKDFMAPEVRHRACVQWPLSETLSQDASFRCVLPHATRSHSSPHYYILYQIAFCVWLSALSLVVCRCSCCENRLHAGVILLPLAPAGCHGLCG